MRDVSAGVAADLLAPTLYERFVTLFPVASRKSLLAWRQLPSFEAQLLLVDASTATQLGAKAPCAICVGGSFPEKVPNALWVARLPFDYTLSDLIDVLDRAAVFLMDWRARQRAPVPLPAVPAAREPLVEATYQLSAWVSMGAPFHTGDCIRALALLTREPVSVRQLCDHSGVDATTAHALLAELSRRGVLRTVTAAPALVLAPHKPRVSGGLVQRLARWVRGGGHV